MYRHTRTSTTEGGHFKAIGFFRRTAHVLRRVAQLGALGAFFLPLWSHADAVFVCINQSADDLFACEWPSEWVLKNPPDVADDDKILYCAEGVPGSANLGWCSGAHWLPKPDVPSSGPVGVCFGASGGDDPEPCNISLGGGEGWAIKSDVFDDVAAPPTLAFAADPTTVARGGASVLTWSSTNASSCAASGAWSGTKPASGSQSTGPLTRTRTFRLRCSGAGGSVSRSVTVAVSTSTAPTLTLTAEPPSVSTGGTTTLTWNSTNATACTASGGWSGSKPTSGSESSGSLADDTVFSLECTGPGGSVARSVTVPVDGSPPAGLAVFVCTNAAAYGLFECAWPTQWLLKNPLDVGAGDKILYCPEGVPGSANLARCDGAHWTPRSNVPDAGPIGVCFGAAAGDDPEGCDISTGGGEGWERKAVVFGASPPVPVPAPTLALMANPDTVDSGGAATLAWTSTDTTTCAASGAWTGAKETSGTESTGPLTATSMFTLSCSGPGGSLSRSVTVNVTAPSPAPTLTLSAEPASVASGGAATLTWSSTGATGCTATGAWSGAKATSGTQSTGALVSTSHFMLTCTGAGGSVSRSVTVTVNALPTLSFTANPTRVASGESSALTWTTTDASSCTASGAWSGLKATSGSESLGPLLATSTFTLSCSGAGGSVSRSVTVAVTSGAATGLDFPGSAAVSTTMRFRFRNPPALYPATYIWRAYPRQQAGYYTAFFWGNDDGQNDLYTFLWKNGGADSYYGAHPYPNPPPDGTSHRWEIAIEQTDYTNGEVVYDRWYTQALVVWADASGNKHHEFYWDLPNTDAAHRVVRVSPPDWGNHYPPAPALNWGDAPWAPGQEVWNGILRGIQIYSTNLSLADILGEASLPLSTAAGAANVWYLNLDPTPSDIADKSGRGHHPEWVGGERPALWSE